MAQIATQIFVLPTAVLGVGVHGPFVSPQVGAAFGAYQLTVAQGLSWPTSGQVLEVTVERSQDGGATWQFDASTDFGPAPWTVNGSPVTTASWIVYMGTSVDGVLKTAATDLFRFTLTALQSCTPVLTVLGVL